MKYIVTYTAKRKNAKRHVCTTFGGRPMYFNSVEEAKKHPAFNNEHYITEVLTANYKPVE